MEHQVEYDKNITINEFFRSYLVLRGEPWPLTPPPICVEAADTVYGLGTSRMETITIEPYGWETDLLL